MLESFKNIGKMLLLYGLLSFNSANAQNTVSGNINKIPTNTPALGRVTLEDIVTHDKFSTFSNFLTGNYSLTNIPSSTYKTTVEVDKHHLWLDTIKVNSNLTLNNNAYPYDTTLSTHPDLKGISILLLNKFLTNTLDFMPNHNLPRSRNVDRLWLHLDSTGVGDTNFMPPEYEVGIRRAIDSISSIPNSNHSYREEVTDSAGGNRLIFVTSSEMQKESGQAQAKGYTKKFANGLDIYRADIFINKDYVDTTSITRTALRELFCRATGLQSNSPDNLYVTYISSNSQNQIHPDEKKVFANMFALLLATDMFNYKDSVCSLRALSNLNFDVFNRWNMVSLPVDSGNVIKSQVFPTATSNAYAYEGFYATKDSLKHGKGYWLKFSGAQNISVQGVLLDRDTIDVINGWNMIGSISTPLHKGQIRTIPENMSLSDLFGYNGSYNPEDSIKPGKGYWVKTNTVGKIILDKDNTITAIAFNKNEVPPSPPGTINKESIDGFVLGQNYPNPFNNSTNFDYQLKEKSYVTVEVYNSLGQVVKILENGKKDAGNYKMRFDADELSSGMYYVRMKAQGREYNMQTRKVLLMK